MKNPEAVESYVVWRQEKGKQWERVRETKKTKALITGLKSETGYQFRVTATNSLIKSVAITQDAETEWSKAKAGALSGVGACVCSPVLVGLASGYFIGEKVEDKLDKDFSTGQVVALFVALSVATLPISIISAPVTAPVLAVWGARENIKDCYRGDLSPESDDETS